MPVKARFQLARLPRALKKDLREKYGTARKQAEPSRYWRATFGQSQAVFYTRHLAGVIERLIDPSGKSELLRDTIYQPVSDDLDEALKLNDAALARNRETIRDIAAHVADGHHNAAIGERLRRLCETYELYESEAILASAEFADRHGPLEIWCAQAIDQFQETEMRLMIARQEIIRAAEGGAS